MSIQSIFIDPTYLRTIYDGLLSGTLHKDNASALPAGLVGLYEESLPPASHVKERQKFLEFFSVWAVLRKEVSVEFVASVLNTDGEYVRGFVAKYSKWFSIGASARYQLYHNRLKIFLIQKLNFNEFSKINNRISKLLIQSIDNKTGDELEIYAMEFIAFHLKKQYWLIESSPFPSEVLSDNKFWERQKLHCKSYLWTLNNIREVINDALNVGDETTAVRYAVDFLRVDTDMISDFEGVIENIQSGNDEYFFDNLSNNHKNNTDKVGFYLSVLLYNAASEEKPDRAIRILTRIKSFIDNANFDIKLGFIPSVVKFKIAQMAFDNQLDFDFIFGNEKYKLSEIRHYTQKPFNIIVEDNKNFYSYLIKNKYNVLSTEIKDSLLYSAISDKDGEFTQEILDTGFNKFSSKTAQKIAYNYYINKDADAFIALIKQNEDFIHFLPILFIRMELFTGKENVLNFINSISERFYKALMLAQFIQGMMLMGKVDTSDQLLEAFKQEVAFDDSFSEILNLLEIKRQILDNPEKCFSFIGRGELVANHLILILGARKETENMLLEFYRKCNLPLHILNRESVKKIAFLLGVEGDVNEFIDQKKIEQKENYHNSSGGFLDYEDEIVLSFLQGLNEAEFNEKTLVLLTYLESPDNLGVAYRGLRKTFINRLLYYLCIELLENKENVKATKLFHILERTLPMTAAEENLEAFRNYLDVAFRLGVSKYSISKINNKYNKKLSWNSEYHLAKVAENYLLKGDIEKAHFLLVNSNPNKWEMHFLKSSLKWHNTIDRFIKVYIDKDEILKAVELAEKSGKPLKYMLTIVENKRVEDRNIINKIHAAIFSFFNEKRLKHSSRISQEVQNRLYFEELIVVSDIYCKIDMRDLALKYYDTILDQLKTVYNVDDYQWILCKLCVSLLKNKINNYYKFIINNIDILDRMLHFGLSEDWIENLFALREEFKLMKDTANVQIINDKLVLFRSEAAHGNHVQDKSVENKSAVKLKDIYIGEYQSYSNMLFNADRKRILEFLIKYSANICFEEKAKAHHILDKISMILDLNKWEKLGKSQP